MISRSQTITSVWIHGSSLGDVNALRSISAEMHSKMNTISLSASTKSGRTRWDQLINEGHFENPSKVTLREAPLLSPIKAINALKESGAQLLILELLEVWPSWVLTWSKRGVKVVVVDGRLSKRTLWARPLLRPSFKALSLFLAQSDLDAQRARMMGCTSSAVVTCGDAKLDSLLKTLTKSDVKQGEFTQASSIDLIVGCVRRRDERALVHEVRRYLDQRPQDQILIAPRHLKRVDPLLKALSKRGVAASRVSDQSKSSVKILDEYGVLSSLYRQAHCAIIGGTFFNRGQNLIEAAYGGCGVIFGPRMDHHRAQARAVEEGGAYRVDSWSEAFTRAALLQLREQAEISIDLKPLLELSGVIECQLRLIRALDL